MAGRYDLEAHQAAQRRDRQPTLNTDVINCDLSHNKDRCVTENVIIFNPAFLIARVGATKVGVLSSPTCAALAKLNTSFFLISLDYITFL